MRRAAAFVVGERERKEPTTTPEPGGCDASSVFELLSIKYMCKNVIMIRSKKDNPDIFLSRTRNRITLSNFCHLWVTHVSAVDQSFLCGCAEMEQGTNRHKFSVFQPNVDRLNQGQPKSVR